MIVSVQDSGVLELFWRHSVNRPFPRSATLDFFSRLPRRSDVLRLRYWLAAHSGCEPLRNFDDATVLERVATAVSSGELLVAEDRFGERWPGTGIVIELLSGSVLLLPRRKLRPGRDLEFALEWLHTLTQPEQTEHLHAMLWTHGRSSPINHDSGEFLSVVEKLLRSGQLIPVYHAFPGHTTVPLDGPAAPASSVIGGLSDREEIVDPSTFGPDHAIAAQIAAMIEAAQNGVPFCEECYKARLRGSAT